MTPVEKWKIKPCPICKATDRIDATSKDVFMRVLKSKECQGSLVTIYCYKCGLELKLYDAQTKDDYERYMKKNVARWNKLSELSEKEMDDDGK